MGGDERRGDARPGGTPAGAEAPRVERCWRVETVSGSRYVVALDVRGDWWLSGENVPSSVSAPLADVTWRVERPTPWPPALGYPLWIAAARDLPDDDPARLPGGGKITSLVRAVEERPVGRGDPDATGSPE